MYHEAKYHSSKHISWKVIFRIFDQVCATHKYFATHKYHGSYCKISLFFGYSMIYKVFVLFGVQQITVRREHCEMAPHQSKSILNPVCCYSTPPQSSPCPSGPSAHQTAPHSHRTPSAPPQTPSSSPSGRHAGPGAAGPRGWGQIKTARSETERDK